MLNSPKYVNMRKKGFTKQLILVVNWIVSVRSAVGVWEEFTENSREAITYPESNLSLGFRIWPSTWEVGRAIQTVRARWIKPKSGQGNEMAGSEHLCRAGLCELGPKRQLFFSRTLRIWLWTLDFNLEMVESVQVKVLTKSNFANGALSQNSQNRMQEEKVQGPVCAPVYAFVCTCMSRMAQIQDDTELEWF